MYAHILLFQCTKCLSPVPVTRLNSHQKLEEIDDTAPTPIMCQYCGTQSMHLFEDAKGHTVQEWDELVGHALG